MRKTVQIHTKIKKDFPALQLSENIVSSLEQYLEILTSWNKKINLTAVRDPETMVTKHILDSLAVFKLPTVEQLQPFFSGRILDMGSGAGIPGIILAIIDPTLQIYSIDKAKKKIMFQDHVKNRLQLVGFNPRHTRLEDFAKLPENKNNFDVIISRAFDQIKGILPLGDLFLKPGGRIVLWKGKRWQEEVDDTSTEQLQGYQISSTTDYLLGDGTHGGTLVVINKTETSDATADGPA